MDLSTCFLKKERPLDDQLESSRRGKTIESIKGKASDTNL
jgi:hypothetical protein